MQQTTQARTLGLCIQWRRASSLGYVAWKSISPQDVSFWPNSSCKLQKTRGFTYLQWTWQELRTIPSWHHCALKVELNVNLKDFRCWCLILKALPTFCVKTWQTCLALCNLSCLLKKNYGQKLEDFKPFPNILGCFPFLHSNLTIMGVVKGVILESGQNCLKVKQWWQRVVRHNFFMKSLDCVGIGRILLIGLL